MEVIRRTRPGRLSTRRIVALAQGFYFATTGIWPIFSIKTFEAVTGPKRDHWLVKTVGALVGILGGVLIASASKREPSRDLEQVAVGSAAALAAVDAVYVARKRISPIYLLDTVAEAVLILGWYWSGREAAETRRRAG